MDALSVLALATQCVNTAPAPVVAAMALAQTDGSIYSVIIDDKPGAPADFDAAIQSAAIGLLNGGTVKVGITGMPTTEFDKRNIAYSDGFSACRNMNVAGEVLHASWKQFGSQADHWRLAVLETATGKPVAQGDFSKKYDAALVEVTKAAQGLTQISPARTKSALDKPAIHTDPLADIAELPSLTPTKRNQSWDVYGRDTSQSLLIFSK